MASQLFGQANNGQVFSLSDNTKSQKCIELLKPLDLNDNQLRKMMQQLEHEIAWAAADDENTRAKSSLGMKPAFISELMNGNENGHYLALDVGGTHFRVLLISIDNGRKAISAVEFYDVPEELLTLNGRELFRFFAECTVEFMRKHYTVAGNCTARANLGFCFSLPMDHTTARNATLLHWTKRFRCSETEGHDVTEMLQEQLDNLKANVYVLVNVNDTVGTLMAGSAVNPHTRVGLILGSGSNTAFFERAERVPKCQSHSLSQKMIIMEIDNGAFGDNGSIEFVKSVWDKRVDSESNHPGSYTFEKLIGGAFLGELVRHVLHELIEQNLLFTTNKDVQSIALTALGKPGTVLASDISDTLCDKWEALSSRVGAQMSDGDKQVIKYVCNLISQRTAKLVGGIQAQLLVHMDMPAEFCTGIAVTGSLFEKHPTLQNDTQQVVQRLAPRHSFQFVVVKDGSGEGAALCAAVVDRILLE